MQPDAGITIPFWQPLVESAEAQALVRAVLESNFLNDGPLTARWEALIARRCGARYAVATTSGTAALFLSLKACEIGPGDEVLVPDVTFIATANAVQLAGATPVLVDVDESTWTLCPCAAAAAVTARTKAMLPVHVSGRAAAMPALLALAQQRGLWVIEDAAEALGSRLDGRALGTWGHAGCFSFSPNKTITTGQGGVIVTDDDTVHDRLRALKDQGRRTRGTGGADHHPTLGFNFKFTDVQAAIGMAQWGRLDDRLQRLRDIYEYYRVHLSDVPMLQLPGFRLDRGECPQWVDARVEERKALAEHLREQGMHTRPFWFPLHTQGPYQQDSERFPVSARVSREALWLPSSLTLTDDDLERVCREIHAWASKGQVAGRSA